jgi:DNA polymerase-1
VPPYDIGADSLFVCYSGTEAELACHLALGWTLPENVVDLIVEYRMAINGGGDQHLGLLAACARLGVPVRTSPDEKRRARDRVLEGWPFSAADQSWLLDYVADDVAEEAGVLQALSPTAIGPHAVWRGRFIKAVARMWWRGVPVNSRYTALATDHITRLGLRQRVIDDIIGEFPVFDGPHFKNAKWVQWLEAHSIPVPRTPTGRAAVSIDDLARLSRDHPVLAPFVEAQKTLAQLKDFSLPIGTDNRLRAWFAPFMTATSRAAPPTNGYIYNLPAWTRAIMQPPPGRALAYLDWQAMEFGLAAALSGDTTMREFYQSGDPYLAMAKAAGAVPPEATKKNHPEERNVFKTGLLAAQYGIGAEALAGRLRRPVAFARGFLKLHHELFAGYWKCSDGIVAEAIRSGRFVSRHGWGYRVQPPFNYRSLRNWPIQTAGADILRCACIVADRLGVEMLATAHDAVLIEADDDIVERAIAAMAECMRQAALLLTGGFELRVDSDVCRRGERFVEPRGLRTLRVVDNFLEGAIDAA